MVLFTLDDKLEDYIVFIKSINACIEATDFIEKDLMIKYETIGESFVESFPENWSVWAIKNMGDKLNPQVLSYYINQIIRPAAAFVIYRDCVLSDEADVELKKIFEGKLPVAEKLLADGIIERAKQ